MKHLLVRDLLAFSAARPRTVRADEGIQRVVEQMIADRSTRDVYLVGDDDRFFGVITLRRLARFLFAQDVPDLSSAAEMLHLVSARTAGHLAIRKTAFVGEDDPLTRVLEVMFRFDINEVPVLDADRRVTGCLSMLELVAAWHAGKLGPARPEP